MKLNTAFRFRHSTFDPRFSAPVLKFLVPSRKNDLIRRQQRQQQRQEQQQQQQRQEQQQQDNNTTIFIIINFENNKTIKNQIFA